MDPDAALALIRELIELHTAACESGSGGESSIAEDVVERFTDLDTWLSQGGFLPLAWQNFGGLKTDPDALPLYFTSVNEDDVVYDHHETITDAVAMLRQFPNDIVVLTLGEPYTTPEG